MTPLAVDIRPPFEPARAARLAAGDLVALTGPVLTFRDASAARLASAIEQHAPLPAVLEGCVLYAVGPSPPQPGRVIGSAGPTTTARMARYIPALLSAGVRAIIGKGELQDDTLGELTRRGALYFAAVGGAGALLAQHVVSASVVAYEDLGPEALFGLELDSFPATVIVDTTGANLHRRARVAWRR